MSLLDKLKSLLGLGSSDEEPRQDVGVTVERTVGESESADEDTEQTGDVEDEPDEATADEDGASETDGAAEDDSIDDDALIDEAEPDEEGETVDAESTDDPGAEAESAEADVDEDLEDVDAEEDPEDVDAEEDPEDADADEEPTRPTTDTDELEDIKGIGPAYAERLGEAGIESIAELADADPAEIAADTGLSESRVENWVEQAKVR